MYKKEGIFAVYNELTGKLLLNNSAKGKVEETNTADIYINHYTKEIRLYNLNKANLSNEDISNIIFGILEESVFFPRVMFSDKRKFGRIEEYVLLVNGYLLDGRFKEPGVVYNSMLTEFIDNTYAYPSEPPIITKYRFKLKSYVELFLKDNCQKEIVIPFKNESYWGGYKEYINMAILLRAYLKDKRIKANLKLNNKFFEKEKEIVIMPVN